MRLAGRCGENTFPALASVMNVTLICKSALGIVGAVLRITKLFDESLEAAPHSSVCLKSERRSLKIE
jgi:hypothetical protein